MGMHLYWAGHEELGGWMFVCNSEAAAIDAAHDDFCDCGGEPLDCEGWSATSVDDRIDKRYRLDLTKRQAHNDPTPSGAARLWWIIDVCERGEFVAARTEDEAVESWRTERNDDERPSYVDEIERIDGYDVRLVEAAP